MNAAQRNRLQSSGLAFLAAYVDTLGFIALFGLFTAHVTGNFILIGAALADTSQMSILLKFLAFPAFLTFRRGLANWQSKAYSISLWLHTLL